jgi:hypothetical protein
VQVRIWTSSLKVRGSSEEPLGEEQAFPHERMNLTTLAILTFYLLNVAYLAQGSRIVRPHCKVVDRIDLHLEGIDLSEIT